MTKPAQNRSDIMGLGARGQGGPVDHDDRNAKRACGKDFGLRAAAARVLGHHAGDAMMAHQRQIARGCERPAIQHHRMIGKRRGRIGRIDQAQQIEMLGIEGKFGQMHSAHGQQDTFARPPQRGARCGNIGHMDPAIARFRLPRRTAQRNQRRSRDLRGVDGIAADLRGKGMGCIDQMADRVIADIARQPAGPAKAANAARKRLWRGPVDASGQRYRAGQSGRRHGGAKRRGLGCAAKDQGVEGHG